MSVCPFVTFVYCVETTYVQECASWILPKNKIRSRTSRNKNRATLRMFYRMSCSKNARKFG